MSIVQFKTYQLLKEEHFQFMSDFYSLIEKYQAAALGVETLYAAFQEKFATESNNLQQERSSLKSASIAEADSLRDQTWTAVRGRVKATESSPFDEERESARALMRVIDMYGSMRKKSYQTESAALTNLTSDLLQVENAGHLAVVGIEAWVNELATQNENFIALVDERNEEYSGRTYGDTRTIRQEVDGAYEQIAAKINALILLEMASEQVAPFAGELNQKIKYYEGVVTTRLAVSGEE